MDITSPGISLARDRRGKRLAGDAGSGPALDAEALDLVRRAAGIRRGLALLHRAPIDVAAVTLGVHPAAVDRARAALEVPRTRAEAVAVFAAAAGQRGVPLLQAPPSPSAVAPDAEAVLAEARRRAGSAAVLAAASPEYAAIVFGTYPDVVVAARAALVGCDPPTDGLAVT